MMRHTKLEEDGNDNKERQGHQQLYSDNLGISLSLSQNHSWRHLAILEVAYQIEDPRN